MFLLLVAPDLVYHLWLCMALFALKLTDPLRKHWVLIFPARDELSVIVLNFLFSFQMRCYCCGVGKEGAGSGNDSGLREAFYECLQECIKHQELNLPRVFSVPVRGVGSGAFCFGGVCFYPNHPCFCGEECAWRLEHWGWNSCCPSRPGRVTEGNTSVLTQ